VAEYGEEDAKYVWEAMHPKLDGKLQPVYFIHTVPDPAAVEKCRAKAAEEERDFRELDGDLRLLEMLLAGDWPEDEFPVVPPGRTIRQSFDPAAPARKTRILKKSPGPGNFRRIRFCKTFRRVFHRKNRFPY